jgi:tetratricopeptide (TPR) repeat protein
MEPELAGAGQADSVALLRDENDNLRAAVLNLLAMRDWESAARFARHLFLYWWLGGLLGEVRSWMDQVLASGDALSDVTRAFVLYTNSVVTYWQGPTEQIVPQLLESADLYRRAGDRYGEGHATTSLGLALLIAHPDPKPSIEVLERSATLFLEDGTEWAEAIALATLGRVHLLHQNVADAVPPLEAALRLARHSGNGFVLTIALNHRAWAHLAAGDPDAAEVLILEALDYSRRVGHHEGVAYALESLLGVAAARGDAERAGRLLGAATTLREQTGFFQPPAFAFHQRVLDRLRAGPQADTFERGLAAGRMLSPEEAIGSLAGAAVTGGVG